MKKQIKSNTMFENYQKHIILFFFYVQKVQKDKNGIILQNETFKATF